MRIALRFICASSSAPSRFFVSSFSGQCNERTSLRRNTSSNPTRPSRLPVAFLCSETITSIPIARELGHRLSECSEAEDSECRVSKISDRVIEQAKLLCLVPLSCFHIVAICNEIPAQRKHQ